MIEDIQQIYSMNDERLYNEVMELVETEDLSLQLKDKLDLIKNGKNLLFPIHKLTRGHYTEYPHNNKVVVEGIGKVSDILFYDERDKRRRLMRQIIIDNFDEGNKEPRN